MSTPTTVHVLDNPAWESLTGAHAQFAEGTERALRYRAAVSPILALSDADDPRAWDELAALVGPGSRVVLATSGSAPASWGRLGEFAGVQMVATDALQDAPDAEAVVLGAADVDDMLALVARNQPGPFEPETYRLGTYLGIRRDGALVAMAGERQHPPGYTEISAVCTDAAYRGQGLAARLVRAVAAGIRARGETPFLHASAENTNAIRLYEALGFELRRQVTFLALLAPER
ncbi:GNAT family N-acetyltransferase [Cellulomonas edaphi]|uniref:GNAT family N-acetyltransferase n=1 Tax=Cellulomonas edaphi TaxID=3053468 RepID=A0ABT7S8F0_9CELL|nr:GNAT family N-acetyltransferase [Cellulomons edaphi]MDM7831307.1 GNAT family N-acetyltransferase [Cellulomons edaphi]